MLTIELVPKSAWFSNVRSMVTKEDWDTLRKQTYRDANYICEICGGKGKYHPVECHEIWQYDDEDYIQTLKGLIALCPACHEVKHIGLAYHKGRNTEARNHLAKINNWTHSEADKYIKEQFETWQIRCLFEWKINLDFLTAQNIKYNLDS